MEGNHLSSFEQKEDKSAPYDFRFLKDKNLAHYALIIDPHTFGVQREYYGFIPISSPKGYANLSIYLINLKDNSIIGEYRASVVEKVEGERDSPPDYTAVVNASKNALAKALSDAYIFFFQ